MLHKPEPAREQRDLANAARSAPRARGRRAFVTAIVGLLLIAGTIAWIMRPQTAEQPRGGRFRAPEGPVPVLVELTRTASVPVYIDGVGTTRALNTVTVKPQVDGRLIEVLFKEGQEVARGDVLAQIDPTIYQAQLDQAVAKKAQDEAQLANARVDVDRYARLMATNAVNRQQLDTQRALVSQLEAQVKQGQAAIDNARAILGHTKVTAPISGRTGLRLVDAGNIVRASDATGLVVITQMKPIAILFTLPQQELARVNQAAARGPLPVEALGADNRTVIDRGVLQVVDNQVDQTTGTVRLKAEFPNNDLQLWPGQFVNVRLLVETLNEAVVVPTAAVQRGPNGTFAYVAGADDAVKVRPISVVLQDDRQAVIGAGLQAGERVVTSGFSRLSDGAAVRPSATEGAIPPAPTSEPQRRRPDGAQRGAAAREGERRERRPDASTARSP